MSSPDPLLPWQRLTAAARQTPLHDSEAAPYGFATRIAARAWAEGAAPVSPLFPQVSWRAFGVAAAVALATLAVNYEALAQRSPEEVVLSADPVSAAVDLTSGL